MIRQLLHALTRLASALIGFALPLLSIFLGALAAAFPGEKVIPFWEIFGEIAGAGCLMGLGFLMFAFGWERRFARLFYRLYTLLALIFPLFVGIWLIRSTRVQFPPVEIPVVLVAFTSWLMLVCVKPGLLGK